MPWGKYKTTYCARNMGHAETFLNPLWDEPEEWTAFSSTVKDQPGTWESSIVVDGMHCATCATTVEDALHKVPGVLHAQVSASRHRAQVVWSDHLVRPSAWVAALAQAGYQAFPANDVFATERRRAETRKALWRWLVAGLCMMQVMMYAYPAYIARPGDMPPDIAQLLRWASWVLTLPVMFFSTGPFFQAALRGLAKGHISMDLPVALGIAITFVVSTLGTFEPQGVFGQEVYFDSLTMFVFFLLTGRWLELRVRDRTAGALEAVMNRLPDSVEKQSAEGSFIRVAARRIGVGDVLRVAPGEAFATDGLIEEGATSVNEAMMTGESRPLARSVGMQVLCGSHNVSATVLVRVTGIGAATRFAHIVALMNSAATSKPLSMQLVDRLAKPFLLGVVLAAGLACVWWWPQGPAHALMVAVSVLIVTCPCALSLATPAALLASAGAMAKAGVLVRTLGVFESLSKVTAVVFDKTGTLTDPALVVGKLTSRAGLAHTHALHMACALAQHSLHPVSRAVVAAMPVQDVLWSCIGVSETTGQGVRGQVVDPATGQVYNLRLGSHQFCGVVTEVSAEVTAEVSELHQVFLADDAGWLATLNLEEKVRPQAAQTVQYLRNLGLEVHMLSGDRVDAAKRVAQQLGIAIAHVQGACSPEDKLESLKTLQTQGHTVMVVGDGLNDAPVLARANVSVAVGNAVPLSQAQADLVILGDGAARVASTLLQSRRTMRVVRQNLWWALAYNAACVPLAIAGFLPAWLAGLGMAISSLGVVLNALRLSRTSALDGVV
jgi:P-type Cu2+ transporter